MDAGRNLLNNNKYLEFKNEASEFYYHNQQKRFFSRNNIQLLN